MRTPTILAVGLLAILATACTSAGSSASPAPASVAPSASTAAVSAAPSEAPSAAPSSAACSTADLATLKAGTLTIGTDNPAYPPYFAVNADGHKTAPWALGDPTNGQGFESAFAYALAEKLGFTKDQVVWTYVPFDNSYKPGAKTFDLDINQVSALPERTGAVDFSDGYYFVNQAVVSLAANPVAKVTTISGLAAYRFGAQVGTSSYKTITDIIKPSADARVYDTNDAAIAGLKAKQIDAIVVDLPTAFFMTGAQLDDKGAVVGQFQLPSGADVEHFGVVMAKGSSLKPCVDAAIKTLTDDGTLAAITTEWLSEKVKAPVFTP